VVGENLDLPRRVRGFLLEEADMEGPSFSIGGTNATVLLVGLLILLLFSRRFWNFCWFLVVFLGEPDCFS
jgi:hypothetical protein